MGDANMMVHCRFERDQVGGGVLYDEAAATKTLRRAIDRCVHDVSLLRKKGQGREGRKIDRGRIFVVGGRDMGMKVNSEAEICKVEPAPTDPASGEVLEIAEEILGKEPPSGWKSYSVVQVGGGGGFSFKPPVRLANR